MLQGIAAASACFHFDGLQKRLNLLLSEHTARQHIQQLAMSQVTLYQHRGVWGLPSLSPADTQVQVRIAAGMRQSCLRRTRLLKYMDIEHVLAPPDALVLQAYLQLAGVEYDTEQLGTAAQSPTGADIEYDGAPCLQSA